jgi:steroid 5-alpha reductase family enzyme
MRAKVGSQFWWLSLITVFAPQAIAQFIVALPLYFAVQSTPKDPFFTFFDVIGVALFAFGFYFETRADKELTEFKSDKSNKGKLLTSGLWNVSVT